MSADRWSKCPVCNSSKESLYGKVSEKEYLESLAEDDGEAETLRQDWEIYLDEKSGVLSISFSCFCSKCGWEARYSIEKDLKANPSAQAVSAS